MNLGNESVGGVRTIPDLLSWAAMDTDQGKKCPRIGTNEFAQLPFEQLEYKINQLHYHNVLFNGRRF
jgi:hypothetical protein